MIGQRFGADTPYYDGGTNEHLSIDTPYHSYSLL